jgi:hypothetical protein
MTLDARARHGDFALGVVPAAGTEEVAVTQRVALRDFSWTPMTIADAVRGAGATLTVDYQYRADGVKGDGEWRSAGTFPTGKEGWTPFTLDVPAADAKPGGFRVRVVVRSTRGGLTSFALDDLAIVNWEAVETADRTPPGFRNYVRLVSDGSLHRISLQLC